MGNKAGTQTETQARSHMAGSVLGEDPDRDEDDDDRNQAVYTPPSTPPTHTPARAFSHVDRRAEERWHISIDALARRWSRACMVAAQNHQRAGYISRVRHIVFGLPAPVMALVTTAVSALWDNPEVRYFVVPATAIAAVLSVIHTSLDMGGRAQRHWDFAARYGSIASKIDSQLVRDVDFRRPADEFIAEVRTEIGNLNAYAPQPPNPGICRGWRCCAYALRSDAEASISSESTSDGVDRSDEAKFWRANQGLSGAELA